MAQLMHKEDDTQEEVPEERRMKEEKNGVCSDKMKNQT